MAKSKQPPRSPGKPDDSVHLDETITHLTDDVAEFFKKHRNLLITVGVVAIAAVALTATTLQVMENRRKARADDIRNLFQKPAAEIRQEAPRMLADLRGDREEPYFVSTYVNWLMDQDTPVDWEEARRLLQDARERMPEATVLEIMAQESDKLAQDADFEVPPPPPPPEPEPGAGAPPAAGTEPPAETAPPAETEPAPEPETEKKPADGG